MSQSNTDSTHQQQQPNAVAAMEALLRREGLEDCIEPLVRQAGLVNVRDLSGLEDKDLLELGIVKMFHRRRLLALASESVERAPSSSAQAVAVAESTVVQGVQHTEPERAAVVLPTAEAPPPATAAATAGPAEDHPKVPADPPIGVGVVICSIFATTLAFFAYILQIVAIPLHFVRWQGRSCSTCSYYYTRGASLWTASPDASYSSIPVTSWLADATNCTSSSNGKIHAARAFTIGAYCVTQLVGIFHLTVLILVLVRAVWPWAMAKPKYILAGCYLISAAASVIGGSIASSIFFTPYCSGAQPLSDTLYQSELGPGPILSFAAAAILVLTALMSLLIETRVEGEEEGVADATEKEVQHQPHDPIDNNYGNGDDDDDDDHRRELDTVRRGQRGVGEADVEPLHATATRNDA